MRIGALKIFGHIRVRTPAAGMAGECFIHCAMPLGQEGQSSIWKIQQWQNLNWQDSMKMTLSTPSGCEKALAWKEKKDWNRKKIWNTQPRWDSRNVMLTLEYLTVIEFNFWTDSDWVKFKVGFQFLMTHNLVLLMDSIMSLSTYFNLNGLCTHVR